MRIVSSDDDEPVVAQAREDLNEACGRDDFRQGSRIEATQRKAALTGNDGDSERTRLAQQLLDGRYAMLRSFDIGGRSRVAKQRHGEALQEYPAPPAKRLIGRRHFHNHGFEYQVTLSQVSDRALCAVMSLHYDRSSVSETDRAACCHDALVGELLAAGYIPYRGAPQTVAFLHEAAPAYWETCRRIKDALDPDHIVAPGRYIPDEPV